MPEKRIDEIFIDNLKRLLEENHVTSQEFARAIGVSPSTVSMWLTNKSLPRMDLLDKIADYFDIDVVDLYFDNSKRSEHIAKIRQAMKLPTHSHATLAAHFAEDEYSESELEEIRQFAEFVKSKRKAPEE